MAATHTDFYDAYVALIDSIVHDADPINRLKALELISTDGKRILLSERNRAAYELRTVMQADDAARSTGYSRKHLNYWASRHYSPNRKPLMTRRKPNLANAVDVSGVGLDGGSSQSPS